MTRMPARQRHGRSPRGFTIIELLVVVSVVALLIGILLPAIGKARDQARLTGSQNNLRNLATAHETYGTEWNDRQFTLIADGLSSYGNSAFLALDAYINSLGGTCGPGARSSCPTGPILGWGKVNGQLVLHEFPIYAEPPFSNNISLVQPIVFTDRDGVEFFGSFRLCNVQQFNQYVGGKFYDAVFYAPKDTIVNEVVEDACEGSPSEFCFTGNQNETFWSSYILSPAGMFAPQVLGPNRDDPNRYYNDPWGLQGGFRSPAVGQCKYPNLKSRMLEHHWLQNPRGDCNPGMSRGTYDGCEPYYFNHGWESVPVTLFYDGHVEGLGTREASQDNLRVLQQTGGGQSGHGLWSKDTPFGGDYADRSSGGYFMDEAYDWTSTSYHILTLDGITGRDKLDK